MEIRLLLLHASLLLPVCLRADEVDLSRTCAGGAGGEAGGLHPREPTFVTFQTSGPLGIKFESTDDNTALQIKGLVADGNAEQLSEAAGDSLEAGMVLTSVGGERLAPDSSVAISAVQQSMRPLTFGFDEPPLRADG